MKTNGTDSALDRRCRWIILLFAPILLGIGCSPASLGFLLMPFVDNRIQPSFKLASKNKETTVVIMTNFGYREHRPDFLTVDRDLTERLASHLRKRCQDNKEKITIIAQSRVKSYLAKQRDEALVAKQEIGKHFKADYVISLEVSAISLHPKGSSNLLHRGDADVTVTVYDVGQADAECVVFEKNHQWTYPPSGESDAGDMSTAFFRTKFLDYIAWDVTKWFTAYPMEERHLRP